MKTTTTNRVPTWTPLRLLPVLTMALVLTLGCGEKESTGLRIYGEARSIVLDGRIFPERYNTGEDRARGHHLVVWSGGRNAHKALIEVDCPDLEVAKALRTIGAQAGRPLPAEVWTERETVESPYPDWRAEGSELTVSIRWREEMWHPVDEFLLDSGASGVEVRFEGQEELIPKWHSGCVICLASCPGGKSSNARYTIRDQVSGRMDFHANEEELPPDGTRVQVRFQLSADSP